MVRGGREWEKLIASVDDNRTYWDSSTYVSLHIRKRNVLGPLVEATTIVDIVPKKTQKLIF